MRNLSWVLYFLVSAVLLTLLTQTGGVILIVAYLMWKLLKWDLAILRIGSFVAMYLVINLLLVPSLAGYFGRRPLPVVHDHLRPQNWFTVLANRNYVSDELYQVVMDAAADYHATFPDRKLVYLDAAFPLGEKLPLPPHRAHSRGTAIDLAFAYTDADTGEPRRRAPNFLAYGRYEDPQGNEPNWPRDCRASGSWWYGLPQVFALRAFDNVEVDRDATRKQLQQFSRHPKVKRIFLEPHLKQRWHLMAENKIRFHGCKAMRHDDHYHVEIVR